MIYDYIWVSAIVTSPIWIMMVLCMWEHRKRNEKDI